MVAVLADEVGALCERVLAATAVVPVGGRTHWEVGGPPPSGGDVTEVTAPGGILAYDPAELTVSVGAGTSVAELAAVLAAAGQECPLDPADAQHATVGGTLAAGLSGPRRLRYGPLRDRVLEVRFVTAEGRLVRAGGPTVKNVTGFDLPRLLVGSLGTIGVITQVVLRCQPLPPVVRWCEGGDDPFALRRRAYRPSCIAWDGERVSTLVEGTEAEVDEERERSDLGADLAPPAFPTGEHRGRVSVPPGRLSSLGRALRALDGVRWLAEVGVGTVHVAADAPEPMLAARAAAETEGGWMLREAGAGVDAFGGRSPKWQLPERIKVAFDPTGKLSPGRLW